MALFGIVAWLRERISERATRVSGSCQPHCYEPPATVQRRQVSVCHCRADTMAQCFCMPQCRSLPSSPSASGHCRPRRHAPRRKPFGVDYDGRLAADDLHVRQLNNQIAAEYNRVFASTFGAVKLQPSCATAPMSGRSGAVNTNGASDAAAPCGSCEPDSVRLTSESQGQRQVCVGHCSDCCCCEQAAIAHAISRPASLSELGVGDSNVRVPSASQHPHNSDSMEPHCCQPSVSSAVGQEHQRLANNTSCCRHTCHQAPCDLNTRDGESNLNGVDHRAPSGASEPDNGRSIRFCCDCHPFPAAPLPPAPLPPCHRVACTCQCTCSLPVLMTRGNTDSDRGGCLLVSRAVVVGLSGSDTGGATAAAAAATLSSSASTGSGCSSSQLSLSRASVGRSLLRCCRPSVSAQRP